MIRFATLRQVMPEACPASCTFCSATPHLFRDCATISAMFLCSLLSSQLGVLMGGDVCGERHTGIHVGQVATTSGTMQTNPT
jgi:hypothetical protein